MFQKTKTASLPLLFCESWQFECQHFCKQNKIHVFLTALWDILRNFPK